MLRIVSIVALALAVAAGCGSKTPPPAEAEPPAPTEPTEPTEELTSCDEACTQYAVCYEEIYGGEYTGGGACTSDCEERPPEDQAAYLHCISVADCEGMSDC